MISKEEETAMARSTISDPSMAVYDEEFRCIFLYHNGLNHMPGGVWECDEWIPLQDTDMYWIVKESLRNRSTIGYNDRIDGSNKVRMAAEEHNTIHNTDPETLQQEAKENSQQKQ